MATEFDHLFYSRNSDRSRLLSVLSKVLIYEFTYLHEDARGDLTPQVAYRVVMVSGRERMIGDRADTPRGALSNFSPEMGRSSGDVVRRIHHRYPQVIHKHSD